MSTSVGAVESLDYEVTENLSLQGGAGSAEHVLLALLYHFRVVHPGHHIVSRRHRGGAV